MLLDYGRISEGSVDLFSLASETALLVLCVTVELGPTPGTNRDWNGICGGTLSQELVRMQTAVDWVVHKQPRGGEDVSSSLIHESPRNVHHKPLALIVYYASYFAIFVPKNANVVLPALVLNSN